MSFCFHLFINGISEDFELLKASVIDFFLGNNSFLSCFIDCIYLLCIAIAILLQNIFVFSVLLIQFCKLVSNVDFFVLKELNFLIESR